MGFGGIESFIGSNQSIVFEGKMSESHVGNPSRTRRATSLGLLLLPLIICLAGPSLPRKADCVPQSPFAAKFGMSWNPNPESDLMGYYVYRGLGPNPESLARISGLLTEPTFTDSTVVPGSIYSYAVSAVDTFYAESGLSNRVVGMIPSIEVESPLATASNNSRKLIKDERKKRFHLTYSSGGNVWATRTDCEGCLWKVPQALGEGQSPSIAVDDLDRPWIVWIGSGDSSSILCSTLLKDNWTPQDTLIKLGTTIRMRSLSFAIDNVGQGWILADAQRAAHNSVSRTHFTTLLIRFDTHRSGSEVTCTTLRNTLTPEANSVIDIDKDGNLHAVWQRRGRILYRKGRPLPSSVAWSRNETISRRTVTASHASIECHADTLFVAWDGKSLRGTPDQIWLRKKPVSGRAWSSAVRVDTSNGSESRFPVLSGGSSLMWVEFATHGSVFCSVSDGGVWKGPIAVELADGNLGFPHVVSYGGALERSLFACWTAETADSVFVIENKKLDVDSLLVLLK